MSETKHSVSMNQVTSKECKTLNFHSFLVKILAMILRVLRKISLYCMTKREEAMV